MRREVQKGCCQCRLVHWCHGAVGLLPLLLEVEGLCTAAEKEKVHAAAEKAGHVIWERGLLLKVEFMTPVLSPSLQRASDICEQHAPYRGARHAALSESGCSLPSGRGWVSVLEFRIMCWTQVWDASRGLACVMA